MANMKAEIDREINENRIYEDKLNSELTKMNTKLNQLDMIT
jgi:hypothetical protein